MSRLAGNRALWLLGLIVVLCFVGPLLYGVDPDTIDLRHRLRPPGPGHPLGTDENGRDVLARLLAGGRISLAIGFGAGLLATALALAVGLLAGWLGGPVGAVLMRLTDLALAFPTLFVLLLATALIGTDGPALALLIGLTLWMSGGRVLRGRTLELRRAPYVEAAIALGATPLRLLSRHVAPNLRETAAVVAILAVNHAIESESTVSFLGLGVRPPAASWGTLLTNAQGYLAVAPWLAIAPGVAILLTVLATYLVADSLRAPRRRAPTGKRRLALRRRLPARLGPQPAGRGAPPA